jgi:tetratricopeptide (TPR) repeat protein
MATSVELPQPAQAPETAPDEAPRRRFRPAAVTVAVAAAVVALSFNSGSYDVLARNPVAIAVWWAIVLGVGTLMWPRERLPRSAWLTGGLLAAYAALTVASIGWASSAEGAFNELGRVTLYLGVFAVVVLAARRASAAAWSDGAALGIGAIGVVALVVRLFPHLVPSANRSPFFPGDARANYPLGYWNGLAVMMAIGVAPLLRLATAARGRVARAGAVALLPALAAVIDLTLSRGGAVAAGIGAAIVVVLAPRRLRTLAAIAAAGVGSAVAAVALAARPAIANGLAGPHAASEGRAAAGLILLGCLVAAWIHLALERFVPERGPEVSRGLKRVVAVVAVAAIAAGIVAADPAKRFTSFKRPPAADKVVLSSSGNGRWQLWRAALDEFRAHPVAGGGAGSYEAWWAAHASFPYFTLYAHSLYLQSLAELGVLGLTLTLGLLIAAALALRRRLRESAPAERGAIAAVGAGFFAFALAAAVDWMWELTVVAVIGVGLLAVLTGPAAMPPVASARRFVCFTAGRLGAVTAAVAAIVVLAIPYVAGTLIDESQQAFRRGDLTTAARRAGDARDVQPWAASPRVQLALVHERQGRFGEAADAIQAALTRDRSDWRSWLIAARIEAEAGHTAAARADSERARALNPKSPIWSQRPGVATISG